VRWQSESPSVDTAFSSSRTSFDLATTASHENSFGLFKTHLTTELRHHLKRFLLLREGLKTIR
jgi:hypothetical protein